VTLHAISSGMKSLFLLSALAIDPGTLPLNSYPGFNANADSVWAYVKNATQLDLSTPAPKVFLYPFVPAAGSGEFKAFRDNWIQNHTEIWNDWQVANPGKQREPSDFPFPAQFMGFYFTGTGAIELNPADFTNYLYQDPDGVMRDHSGVGFYNLGHELHHYALEQKGVPIRLHHCVFLLARGSSPSPLMEALAEELIKDGTASFLARMRGYQGEVALDPCGALSKEDQKVAQDWAKKL
jgi:hypothetical protein